MTESKNRRITAEDLYSFTLISDVRISPDATRVAYALQRIDRKKEKKYSNLWLASVDGSSPVQFTWGDQKDSQPRFSPDGKWIAFLSNRGDLEKPAQIYLIPVNGGEARPLGLIEGDIGSFAWSLDGRKLLCTVRKTDAEAFEREKDEQKKKLGVVARRVTRLIYKMDDEGYLPLERWHLWSMDVKSGKARQLTDHPVYDELSPAWSPDGKWIAFLSNRSPDPDGDLYQEGVYVIPAAGGEMRQVPAPLGTKSNPSISPDGRWIAWYGVESKVEEYKNDSLWLAPFDGSSPARNLTGQFDVHLHASTISDLGSPQMMPPTWSPDSKRITFPVVYHGSTILQSVNLEGKDLQTLLDEGGVVGSWSFDRTGRRMAYYYGIIDDPCQVYVRELPGGKPRRLSEHNPFLKNINLGKIEEVWYQGAAKNDLQGWVLKPPGFNAQRKYPAILYIHGGPLTQYGKIFFHEFQYLAAQGYVIFFTNPRGGRGYGESHAQAILGDWGNADYQDLMAWTDEVEKLPYIDPARIGVAGGSYGGYMTLWIIGHTQRFKAACAQRVVSNFISEWGSSDYNYSFEQELRTGPPFQDLEKYWKMSPMSSIGNARTPTLVMHNENDLRCPIEQGEQAFVALKRLGVETEMIRFPDEFHGLSRTGRTDRRIVRLKHILRWFDKYLK